jgi:hypothetical protein
MVSLFLFGLMKPWLQLGLSWRQSKGIATQIQGRATRMESDEDGQDDEVDESSAFELKPNLLTKRQNRPKKVKKILVEVAVSGDAIVEEGAGAATLAALTTRRLKSLGIRPQRILLHLQQIRRGR